MIVKSAFDWKLGAHALFLDTAGLRRTFKVFNNLVTPNATGAITEGSGSIYLNFEVLRNFRVIANTLLRRRQRPLHRHSGSDTIVKGDGTLSPIHSGAGVGGFEYQLTPRFEFDGYYSGAYFQRDAFPKVRWRIRLHLRGLWFPGFGQLKQQVISGRDRRFHPDDLGKPEPREVAIHKPVFLG